MAKTKAAVVEPTVKIYCVRYKHSDGYSQVLIPGTSQEEAESRLAALADNGKLEGELEVAWNNARCEEFELLRKLVRECQGLNNGNCVIERMQFLIETAKRLDSWGEDGRRQSFVRFLEDVCGAGRFTDPRP